MTTTHLRHLARLLRAQLSRPTNPETFRVLVAVAATLEEDADQLDEAIGDLVVAWAIDAPEPAHCAVDQAVSTLHEMTRAAQRSTTT